MTRPMSSKKACRHGSESKPPGVIRAPATHDLVHGERDVLLLPLRAMIIGVASRTRTTSFGQGGPPMGEAGARLEQKIQHRHQATRRDRPVAVRVSAGPGLHRAGSGLLPASDP